jgi:transposase
MKNKNNPTRGSSEKNLQNPPPLASLIKLGADAHADHWRVVRQVDNGPLQPAQAMSFKKFLTFAQKQKRQAKRVVVCYEAGTFGFYPARELEKLGVECVVMVPIKLDEGNTRVTTDRLDARRIAVRLDRYLSGDQEALNLVRIPTPVEEEQRDLGRQRQAVVRDLKRYADRGRAYLRKYGHRVKGRWWQAPKWEQLKATLCAAQVSYLEHWVKVIECLHQLLVELNAALLAQAEQYLETHGKVLPAGLGLLSFELLRLEVCDWHRFRNRRQVASMTGLCASESSSGQRRQQGGITRHGNPLLRWVLLEMAWRLVRFQPSCHAVKPWLAELAPTRGNRNRRKQIIVAIARQLAVDLWRVATGQSSFEKLGFVIPPIKAA